MMRYSVQPSDWIMLKKYGFLLFAKNMGTNIGKNINKNLSGKYSHKLLDHGKQSATYSFKTTSKRAIKTVAGATGDLIGKKQLQMSRIKKYIKKDWWFKIKIIA